MLGSLHLLLAAAAAPTPDSTALVHEAPVNSCTPTHSFVHLDFKHATLVRSKLGGFGGRCVSADRCKEVEHSATPHEIYYANVAPDLADLDLRVTNKSAYHAWDSTANGLNLPDPGTAVEPGAFGVVNLLSPRKPGSFGAQPGWSSLSFVELLFEFVSGVDGTPVEVNRTYMSFYDVDAGRALGDGTLRVQEAMAFGPGVSEVRTAPLDTELYEYPSLGAYFSASALDQPALDAFLAADAGCVQPEPHAPCAHAHPPSAHPVHTQRAADTAAHAARATGTARAAPSLRGPARCTPPPPRAPAATIRPSPESSTPCRQAARSDRPDPDPTVTTQPQPNPPPTDGPTRCR